MKLGLGTGSTASPFVDRLGAAVKQGLEVVGVPTSEATRRQAEPRHAPDDARGMSRTRSDGRRRRRSRRGAAAHQGRRRRASARKDRRGVLEADAGDRRCLQEGREARRVSAAGRGGAFRSRLDHACGSAAPSPRSGCQARSNSVRERDGRVFVTDGGHYILDCAFGAIPDAEALAAALVATPGVVDHGLFIGLASPPS